MQHKRSLTTPQSTHFATPGTTTAKPQYFGFYGSKIHKNKTNSEILDENKKRRQNMPKIKKMEFKKSMQMDDILKSQIKSERWVAERSKAPEQAFGSHSGVAGSNPATVGSISSSEDQMKLELKRQKEVLHRLETNYQDILEKFNQLLVNTKNLVEYSEKLEQ